MNRLLAVLASLFLVVSFATPAQSAGAKYSVYQKTLSAFSSSATTLTDQQKAQVKAAVDANPTAEKFICTGIRYYQQPFSINIMVRKRAKAACEYAKQLNPELSTWYQNKPTQARSYAGKVLLTVKTLNELSVSEQILNNAITEISERQSNSQPFNGEINVHVSTGYSQKSVDLAIEATKIGVSYLSDHYVYTGSDFIFFTQKESDWAQTKWDEITVGTTLSSVRVFDESSPFPCKGAEFTYKKNGVTRFITYQCDDGNQDGDVSFGAHGTIHWFQGFFRVQYMPNWLVEGSATLYGEVLGYGVENRNAKKIQWKGDYKLHDALKAGPESIRAEISKVEVKNPSFSPSYTMGRLLYTALIGLHGEDKAIEFMKSFASSTDEEANFQKIYGFSLEEFYQESIPLIADWAVRDWP